MDRAIDGVKQIASGGCAGFVEICIMHPLDLIKTRFQIQCVPSDPHHYNGLVDCVLKIHRAEGLLSLYKGILPPIVAETPKNAVKFFTFEQYRTIFASEKMPMPVTFAIAGLLCGLTEALVINPFEVVKVKLQAEKSMVIMKQRSAYATAREIILKDGFGHKGLNKGLTSTLGRHGIWNMVYFFLYHSLRQKYPSQQDKTASLLQRFSFGLLAGTVASIINIPFDVAKSRVQGPQPMSGAVKYHGCFSSMNIIRKEEGFLALYKGLVPKILRLGPGGAILIVVYEAVYEYLKNL